MPDRSADAYLHIRPPIRQVLLWNRSPEKLQDACTDLQRRGLEASLVQDLNEAVARADIISSATKHLSSLDISGIAHDLT